MTNSSRIFLWDRHKGEPVEALLIASLDSLRVEAAVEAWGNQAEVCARQWHEAGVPREEWPDHHHWNWNWKAQRYSGLLAYQFVGIEYRDAMQGLMLVANVGHYSKLIEQKGKGLAYVHYVATAPWNDPDYVANPRFGLVGKVLVGAAIEVSREAGFRGRLGLHSLPKAEAFYRERCGMADLGVDPHVEYLRYFEMTSSQARRYMSSAKDK